MEVKTAKQMASDLRDEIHGLINRFEADTGLHVLDIGLRKINVGGLLGSSQLRYDNEVSVQVGL